MVPKVFITGTTGYIGGEVLYSLESAHPDWDYSALVRNSDSGAPVAAAYPKIRLVYGGLDDSSVLEAEAANADIVIHTADASDHAGAAKAIAAGVAKHPASSPGYWLHTSGTGILCWKDMDSETYGEPPSSEPYDDLDGVAKLTGLPDSAFHRDIDQIVLKAGTENKASTKTAIVCPPTIYGPGRGPGNKRSRQVYHLASTTLKRGKAPQLGKGLTEWDNVHVQDLSALFVLLAEAAASGKQGGNEELWGEKGYFLAENGHHVWGQVSKEVGQAAYKAGFIGSEQVEPLGIEDAKKAGGFEAISWGLNSKGKARRARKFLGWEPKGRSLSEEIPDIVKVEAEALGKTKKL